MTSVDHYGLLRRAATDAGFTETETATFAELLRFAICTSQQYNGGIAAHSGDLPSGRPADVLVGQAGGDLAPAGERPLDIDAAVDRRDGLLDDGHFLLSRFR